VDLRRAVGGCLDEADSRVAEEEVAHEGVRQTTGIINGRLVARAIEDGQGPVALLSDGAGERATVVVPRGVGGDSEALDSAERRVLFVQVRSGRPWGEDNVPLTWMATSVEKCVVSASSFPEYQSIPTPLADALAASSSMKPIGASLGS
jgi:hypothetical protein